MAQRGHSTIEFQCPLLGVKRTLAELQTPFAAGVQWKCACRFSVIGSIRGIAHLQAASEEV
jgi:hypothetical protein